MCNPYHQLSAIKDIVSYSLVFYCWANILKHFVKLLMVKYTYLLIYLLTDWLTGWLTGWLAACLPAWLAGWLAGCLPSCLPDWLTGWLAGWLTDWLTDWLTELTHWLTDWQTHWQSYPLGKDDLEKFEKNDLIIALEVLYAKEIDICPTYISKNDWNRE